MLIFKSPIKILLAFFCLLLSGIATGDERILGYHTEVMIQFNGTLGITETIRVRSEGVNIRRGIYRDFPTRYQDRLGNHYDVTFDVMAVQRDGAPEAYHTENRSNGIRVYMGSSNSMLQNGEHEYILRYQTSRQIGFFEDYDELYWNVTGNDWAFPIDHASARIMLPGDVYQDQVRTDFYTGAQGSTDKNARSRISSARTVEFETTRGLPPTQGLTVAVGWPKGLIHEPDMGDKMGHFFRDNSAALVLMIGLLLPLGWYVRSWDMHGRDPGKGVIIPRFKPPRGLSAAGCRYIMDMSLKNDAFTAAIISLGVKGYLKIDEKNDDFILYRRENPKTETATTGEAALLARLLPDKDSWIELENENYNDFLSAKGSLKEALKSEHKGRLFNLNSIYMIPAVVMSLVAGVIAVPLQGGPLPWILFVILSLVMHLLFLFLLRAPTPAGRHIMDEIEGFKMYLETAEQFRLDRMKSPELTPEAFEMFLPYAFALGVENNWCERFGREFPEELEDGTSYRPAWYSGHRHGLGALHHFGNNFGQSFSSSISSASTPPGSSSGSGGGGSSGGGGGGGGGGGW